MRRTPTSASRAMRPAAMLTSRQGDEARTILLVSGIADLGACLGNVLPLRPGLLPGDLPRGAVVAVEALHRDGAGHEDGGIGGEAEAPWREDRRVRRECRRHELLCLGRESGLRRHELRRPSRELGRQDRLLGGHGSRGTRRILQRVGLGSGEVILGKIVLLLQRGHVEVRCHPVARRALEAHGAFIIFKQSCGRLRRLEEGHLRRQHIRRAAPLATNEVSDAALRRVDA
mmetsp:Transcript_7437/g.15001  ORF Transcript_7437/g.15001 Transcript_7437/m.15001 type:complete len:230 (-) Transcript_7437:198-887(-)